MGGALTHIVLGAVQGIAEWLPISSSGHLALFEQIFGISENLPYEVFLHMASLIVLLIYFRQDLMRLARAPFIKGMGESRQQLWHIVAATAATVVVALLIEPYESYLRAPAWLAAFFVVNAGLLLAMRGMDKRRVVTMRDAVILGCVQGLAVIPALSRSAITIAVALRLGISRKEAFRFSFLIGIPALAGAAVRVLHNLAWQPIYLVGFFVTLITGYVSLWVLQVLVERDKLYYFWIYNVLVALAIVVYLVY